MFSREKIFNLLKIYFLNKCFFLICGTILAYNSSIEILDLNSNFWLNDQGKFYTWATTSFDFSYLSLFRYALFVYILSLYSFLFNDPFMLVFIYKVSLLTIFILYFYKRIIINYGLKIFIILFISFSYLNLFLLRESLFFLIGLIFVINFLSTEKIQKLKSKIDFYNNKTSTFYKYGCLLTLGLIRPQSIFVYLRPIYAFGFFLLLICYSIVISSYGYPKGNQILTFLSPIESSFYQFIKIPLISLYNINPITKFKFYFDNGLYIEYILLFASSIYLLLLLCQIILSIFSKSFYFDHRNSIISGLLVILFIYSYKNVFIDVRIFVSLLAPFSLFLNTKIFNFKIIMYFLIFLISIDFIKIFLNISF